MPRKEHSDNFFLTYATFNTYFYVEVWKSGELLVGANPTAQWVIAFNENG